MLWCSWTSSCENTSKSSKGVMFLIQVKPSCSYCNEWHTHTHIKIRDLTCIPPLRPSKLSVLHVQIPQQAGIVCPPGLSCSKELQGQTWQVNLRVPEFTPKLSPILLKTQGPPDLLSSFLTTQPRVDLLPQCTPRINISSSCHHPGLLHWADIHIWMSYPLLCS